MKELLNALYTRVWNLEVFVDKMSKTVKDPLNNRIVITKMDELNSMYDVLMDNDLVDGYIDFKMEKEKMH